MKRLRGFGGWGETPAGDFELLSIEVTSKVLDALRARFRV